MKIKPVLNTPTPKYPDKYNEEIRHILVAAKPHRWLGTSLISALSVSIALGLSGCTGDSVNRNDGQLSNGTDVQSPLITNGSDNYVLMGDPVPVYTPTPLESIFIPLFEHGPGTGGIGCVAIVAPVFMSEEEAVAILSAAFADAGIILGQSDDTLYNINLPVTNVDGVPVDPDMIIQGDLVPSGKLEEFNFPVVFISRNDIWDWHQDLDDGPRISWSKFNVINAARTLAENNSGIVVFYDPIAGIVDYNEMRHLEREDGESDEDFNRRWLLKVHELEEAARSESEKMLRQQVEAFIAWLADGGF